MLEFTVDAWLEHLPFVISRNRGEQYEQNLITVWLIEYNVNSVYHIAIFTEYSVTAVEIL